MKNITIIFSFLMTLLVPCGIAQSENNDQGLILWNQLGSDTEVLNSAFGPNLKFYDQGTVQGDREYVDGKVGNSVTLKGSYGCKDRVHNIVLENLCDVINPDQGCIGFWYYRTAIPVSYSYGVYRFFDGAYGLGGGLGFYEIGAVESDPDKIVFSLNFGGASRVIQIDSTCINNHEWVHLAACWDRDGIENSQESMRMYVNGVKVAAETANDWGATVGFEADICGGNDQNIAGKFRIDELKIWDYAKTNFFATSTNLTAARHFDAGDVSVWNDSEYLYIKYETVTKVYLYETHLHVATSLAGIPQTKKGNPIPGHFDFATQYDWEISEDTYTIPLEAGWVGGTELFIASHAVVYTLCGLYETAWGEGSEFPGHNWAMYFTYTIQ